MMMMMMIMIIVIIIIRFHGLSKQSAFIAQLVAVHEFVPNLFWKTFSDGVSTTS